MPNNKARVKQEKNRRWVVVIDKNTKEELAVVRLTTKKSKNSTLLNGYKTGNGKDTYFKHFVETTDNEGKPIKVDGKKFAENLKKYDLTSDQIKRVQNTVLHHTKISSENLKKIKELKK